MIGPTKTLGRERRRRDRRDTSKALPKLFQEASGIAPRDSQDACKTSQYIPKTAEDAGEQEDASEQEDSEEPPDEKEVPTGFVKPKFALSGEDVRMSSLCMRMGSSLHQLVWNLRQIWRTESIVRSLSLPSSTTGLPNSMMRSAQESQGHLPVTCAP